MALTGSAIFKLGLAAALVFLVVGGPEVEAAVACNTVVSDLTPCVGYVMGSGALSSQCCGGVRTLYAQAQTTADRQSVCRCLKSVLNGVSYSSNNAALAAGLPAKCGVNLPYKISPSTDCARVTK